MLRVWADVILHPHFFLLASSIFPCSTYFHGQSPKASKTCSKLFPMAYSCSTRSWHRHLIKKPEYLRAHMSTNRRDCGDCAKKTPLVDSHSLSYGYHIPQFNGVHSLNSAALQWVSRGTAKLPRKEGGVHGISFRDTESRHKWVRSAPWGRQCL